MKRKQVMILLAVVSMQILPVSTVHATVNDAAVIAETVSEDTAAQSQTNNESEDQTESAVADQSDSEDAQTGSQQETTEETVDTADSADEAVSEESSSEEAAEEETASEDATEEKEIASEDTTNSTASTEEAATEEQQPAKAKSSSLAEESSEAETDTSSDSEDVKDGWAEEDGHTVYYSNGEKEHGSFSINNSDTGKQEYYYFDENGYVVKGWNSHYGNKYYYDESTGIAVSGLKTIDGHTYYFDSDGEMLTDTIYEDSDAKKAYIIGEDGYATGTINLSEDGWNGSGDIKCYVKDGSLVENQVLVVDGEVYGFYSDGKLIKNNSDSFRNSDTDEWDYYYFDENGHPVKGWNSHSGNKYYYDESTGIAVSGLKEIDGHTYYFDYDGRMLTNTILEDSDSKKVYVVDGKGYVDTINLSEDGWKESGNIKYYAKDGSLVKKQVLTIDGEAYGFNYNGELIRDDSYSFWNSDTDEWDDYYFDENGHPVKGWNSHSGNKYYYDESTGIAVSGLKTIDGHTYYFDSDGQMLTNTVRDDSDAKKAYIVDENGYVTDTIDLSEDGWKESGDIKCYAKDGSLVKEQVLTIDGEAYGFNYNGELIRDDSYSFWNSDKNKWDYYYFDNDGRAVKGFRTDPYGKYYYDETTCKGITGSKTIDGHLCFFVDGRMQSNDIYVDENEKKAYVTGNEGYADVVDFSTDGWKEYGDIKFYAKDGSLVKEQVLTIDGEAYGFNYKGELIRDDSYSFWNSDKNKWDYYYFDENGRAVKGWNSHYGSKYYYDESTGIAVSGLKEIDGHTYYFDDYSGELLINVVLEDSDAKKYYIAGDDGTVTDPLDLSKDQWIVVGNNKYYAKGGSLVTDQLLSIEGKEYGFNSEGVLIQDESYEFEIDGSDYYFDTDGHPVKGWRTDEKGHKYYYDSETGIAAEGLKEIDGHTYYFDYEGQALTNTIEEYNDEDKNTNKVYMMDENGYAMIVNLSEDGWKENGSVKCYVKDSALVTGQILTVDGKTYGFDDYGKLIKNDIRNLENTETGEYNTYYIDKNGYVVKGWQKDTNGNRYYFDPKTGIAASGLQTVDGHEYAFNDDGSLIVRGAYEEYDEEKAYITDSNGYVTGTTIDLTQPGWKEIDNDKYYVMTTSGTLAAGPTDIGTHTYGFTVNGRLVINSSAEYIYNPGGDTSIDFRFLVTDTHGYVVDDICLSEDGWKQSAVTKTRYYSENGKLIRSWKDIDGSRYYFDPDSGALATDKWIDDTHYVDDSGKYIEGKTRTTTSAGWKQDSTGWQYQNADGTYPKSTWQEIGGKQYYFDGSGYMATDKWIENTYYVKTDGSMARSEWVDNNTSYVDVEGKKVTNTTMTLNGNLYGFDNNGKVLKNVKYSFDTATYCFDKEGHAIKGWQNIDGSRYYFASDGKMVTAKWIDGIYYVKSDGTMARDEWVDNNKYYVDSDGKWVKGKTKVTAGWKKNSTGWWYQNADGSYPKNRWQEINGSWYYFDGSGYMASNKWISGVYYVKASGVMATNEWVDNDKYYVDASGKWVKGKTKVTAGWKKDSKGWWYQNADGSYPKSKWQKISGKWYYFNGSGYIVTGWKQIGGKWYYFESSGAMAVSKWISGVYYVKADGTMAKSEWVDGGKYYVGADGKWQK